MHIIAFVSYNFFQGPSIACQASIKKTNFLNFQTVQDVTSKKGNYSGCIKYKVKCIDQKHHIQNINLSMFIYIQCKDSQNFGSDTLSSNFAIVISLAYLSKVSYHLPLLLKSFQ